MATAEIVRVIPRTDVAAILTPPRRRGSIAGAIAGAVAGSAAAYYAVRHLVLSRRRDATVWMVVALVGLPLGGALIGSQMQRGVTQRVLYRAP